MDKAADRARHRPGRAALPQRDGEGSIAPTGQVVDSAAPVAELLRRLQAMPLPPRAGRRRDLRAAARRRREHHARRGRRRGVGYAVAYKNVGFSEGFDDYSTARVRLEVTGGEPVVTVHTAAAEVGQGLVTVEQQIAAPSSASTGWSSRRRTPAVGSRRVHVGVAADLRHRRRGAARRAVRVRDRAVLACVPGGATATVWPPDIADLAALLGDDASRRRSSGGTGRPRPVDPETGQGNAHVQYAFAAHRAVVDVDVELGLVKVVEMACTQDVGKAINPQAVSARSTAAARRAWAWR